MNTRNVKQLKVLLFTLIAIVTLGIGYAGITAINFVINGDATASVNQENFKVHFTQALAISGSTGASGTSTIDSQDDTKATFDVTGLTKVGDYAEAVYTVRNDSNGVGAEIKLSVTDSNSEYFKVTETILDNKLQAGEETTAKVKVEMIKTPITDSVSTSITATLKASPLEDAEATGGSPASKVAGDPESFTTDSWATIQKAVQNNNTSAYNVGDTKTVTVNGIDYTVRIANKSTAQNCSDTNYSETACGFVVEFAEEVEKRTMNSISRNVGGWPATKMRTYLNGTFYNSLPSDLQAVIKPTRVISGHGSDESTNFTTTDNLYLLSCVEVFGSGNYDTAARTTHQLEYYNNSSNSKIKQYNSSDSNWWLRSADSSDHNGFLSVSDFGGLHSADANLNGGVAPAFRIG